MVHFFLAADFVTFAPEGSFFSTLLITPTATVWRMSLTANLPKGGYSENVSTTMGLVGIIFTMPASPFFKNLGSFSISLPDRRSILVKISANFTAMWDVWQSRTGAYPFPI
ncbi:hypothetical protein Vadar_025738 [Vaccinium darrowii]|uniref:Uncharacterized protein n=1 Tax=Vaccinium darrowii TaxID=229202 RepID=A0ACB7ZEB5_9ERIC|nr:hypothetical protein Vadar_025738 [Vaccinium darrowii]